MARAADKCTFGVFRLTPTIAALLLVGCTGTHRPLAPVPSVRYTPESETITLNDGSQPYLQFGFNRCGAINSILPLDDGAGKNLIAGSFAGETTDRVLQWTYWNSAYLGAEHGQGDGDRRLNATMEGSFGDLSLCQPESITYDPDTATLTYTSEVDTWFYPVLNRHGKPRFQTQIEYQFAAPDTVYIQRSVTRLPVQLKDVYVMADDGELVYWTGKHYRPEPGTVAMQSHNFGEMSFTSYLETWLPLSPTVLPHAWAANQFRFRNDEDPAQWYGNWDPAELGGWVIAADDNDHGLGLVFGTQRDWPTGNLYLTFNRLFRASGTDHITSLLHGIEFDWPDNATVTQYYVLLWGRLENVVTRAQRLKEYIPEATIAAGN